MVSTAVSIEATLARGMCDVQRATGCDEDVVSVETHDDQAGAFQAMLAGVVRSVAVRLPMAAAVVLDDETRLLIQEVRAAQEQRGGSLVQGNVDLELTEAGEHEDQP